MTEPSNHRKKYLLNLPSVYTKVDFVNDVKTLEDRAFWFQKRRVEAWLLKDTRSVVEKGESLFGLAALVHIGIETLSGFAYLDNGKNSSERFIRFLKEYIDPTFSKKRNVTIDFKDHRKPALNPEDAEIFYRGMRNTLMHSFSFRWVELRWPMSEFKRWEPSKKVLKIDSRRLLVKFEDATHKYFRSLWKSNPGEVTYENFEKTFENNFIN